MTLTEPRSDQSHVAIMVLMAIAGVCFLGVAFGGCG